MEQFHPPANVARMSSGQPLTDADRWDWLATIRKAALQVVYDKQIQADVSRHGSTVVGNEDCGVVVVTCSALKKVYRDVLRGIPAPAATTTVEVLADENVMVHFVFLALDKEDLLRRVRERKGHYMKENMVASQWATLEGLDEQELRGDSVRIDAGAPPEKVEVEVQDAVERIMQNDACL